MCEGIAAVAEANAGCFRIPELFVREVPGGSTGAENLGHDLHQLRLGTGLTSGPVWYWSMCKVNHVSPG